ncbi:efflux RND transporter periplasmic adaptor subunit [Vibrio amylolyticus]|uniref:efflux RND transporter periplasmic adaptor subunit n=1 Tax=Vibrio amylolyticus TaxID=2847292 RepID=UPI003553B6F8
MSTFKSSLVLAIPLLLSACGTEISSLPANEPTEVMTKKVSLQPSFYQTQFVGKTSAIDSVDIIPKVSGHIIQRAFIEGSQINKGDLLYVIDPAPYQTEVLRLEALKEQKSAQYALQIKKLEKAQLLGEKNALGSFEIEQIKAESDAMLAEVKAADAELIKAQIQLSHTRVTAPFSGQIGASLVSVGDLVTQGSQSLTHLVSNEAMYVQVQINEQQYLNELQDKLQKGEDISPPAIKLAFANGSFYQQPGKVNFIDNQVDETTGSINVRIKFNNPEHLLLPGQYVTLHMQSTQAEEAMFVPQSIVQEDQGGRFVLTVNEHKLVQSNYLDLGQRVDDKWLVNSGLNVGDHVIVTGIQQVRPGSTVVTLEDKDNG